MALFGKKDQVELRIGGMTCGNCQKHVEEALKGVPGVASAQVDLLFHRAKVSYDPSKASVDQLVEAVKESGYEAEPKGAA